MTIRQRSETRENTYRAIDGERDYQDDGRGNALRHPEEGTAPMSVGDDIVCIDKLLLDAKLAWYRPGGLHDALDHLRKIAAVAVQAMEIHGTPFRPGYGPDDDPSVLG